MDHARLKSFINSNKMVVKLQGDGNTVPVYTFRKLVTTKHDKLGKLKVPIDNCVMCYNTYLVYMHGLFPNVSEAGNNPSQRANRNINVDFQRFFDIFSTPNKNR